ncbi:TonB-dependent receptor plug domain-containing protein [Hanstruepera flava]|uniref:TonB-dependent receptor plug domain-containing protein n=1 Tax=Hanstruepera flava TaxID=2930218 RepID=UPI002027B53C|nr:TonB-dependent receptor [Hanstruepera flava]
MKLKILLCLFLLSIFYMQAQQITVIEKDSEIPLAGVIISSKNKSVITNLDGQAILDNFTENALLLFEREGHKPIELTKEEITAANNLVYLNARVDLDEVVISASKFEQSKRDVPQKIISLTSKEITFFNPQTSADLLENTGNVYIQKSQLGGGSPMIRGFSTNRLLITVDGVRMNNAIFRSGNLQNIISIDPLSIQNTEITLGAGSVVYGSDAIGGVMSFYTKKPQLSYKDDLYFKANAFARYASANNEKTGHLDVNFGLKKWAFLTSISFSDFDDLRMGSHGPDDYLRPEYVQTVNGVDEIIPNSNPESQVPTGFNQLNVMQKARYEHHDNLHFDLGVYYSTTSDYSRYDRLIRYRDENLRSAEWYYGPQQWFMANFQLTKLSSSSNLYDKIQTTIAYQNFKESRHDRNFQSEIKNNREESIDAFSANFDFEKRLSSKTELFYGFEYIYNLVHSKGEEENVNNGNIMPSVSRYPDNSNWQSVAAYTSLKYKPKSNFIIQTGLRYNQVFSKADFTENNTYLNLPFNESKINSGALTGTAGVSWNPNEMLQWKFNLSTAFRAPNIDDVGKVFDSEPGSVVVPNDHLKPEYAYGGELGLLLNFDNVVLLDLATYYTYLDNALVRQDYTLNGESEIIYDGELSTVQAIQNASEAHIYGFELGLKINFSDAFKLTSQYNVVGGTEDDHGVDVPVRHVTPNFGNTHLIWSKNRLKVDLFANYNGELSYNQLAPSEQVKDYIYAKDSNGNPYAPSWYTLNLRAQYNFNKGLLVSGGLENITDQRYKTYSSGIASPGRNLVISLTYTL